MKNTHNIFVFDDLPPEAAAMTQALYSRDPRSVVEHRKKVAEVGAEKFMGSYYVGYGHKSIGDCGTTDIYIENVSMLVAKAVQDWPLYSGQEASTRYLDMTKQEVLNPLDSSAGKKIQDTWMAIYKKTLETLVPFLKERFPRKEEQAENIYNKAISAKAFDIARGLLPAGVTTYLSWHTNLRQAYDHLKWMEHHPLSEVRAVAIETHTKLKEKYTSSFSHKVYETQEKYLDQTNTLTYTHDKSIKKFAYTSHLRLKELTKEIKKNVLSGRPQKTELPYKLLKYGTINFRFPLDFGSFRDLQRHRNGTFDMPLLTTHLGFHPWYLEQLPTDLKKEVLKTLKEQEKRIRDLKATKEITQYYIAMGYRVACNMEIGIPSAVYIAELRSGQTVHPTLRLVAQDIGKALAKSVPNLALHVDYSPDLWDIKRGTQDIVKKK